MEFEEVKRLVDELDKGVPKDNAKVRLHHYGDAASMEATERGYLRFWIELMKAGIAEASPDVEDGWQMVNADLHYLITDDSSISIDTFERPNEITDVAYQESWTTTLFTYAVIGILIALPILALVGLVTVIRWIL